MGKLFFGSCVAVLLLINYLRIKRDEKDYYEQDDDW